jgi:fucose 4-O-acetylase-like acetyltransferase
MENTRNARLAWIDISKGVAMLMVLIGHCMRDGMRTSSPALDVIYRSVYIFHMAWFFWLSGYSYRLSRNRNRQPLQIAGRRLRKQFPYWILYTLFVFAAFTLAMAIPSLKKILSGAGYERIGIGNYMVSAFQANNPWAYHLWFLLVLIIITVIVALADALFRGQHTTQVSIVLIVLGVAGLACYDYISVGNWWRLYNYLSLYLPIFCIGILMADIKIPDTIAWIWGALGLAYIVIRVACFSDFSGNSLRVTGWTRFAVYLAGDLLLPGLMVCLGRIFEKGLFPITGPGKKFFNFLGKESLTIYLWHQPFCCAFLGTLLYGRMHLPALVVMAFCLVVSLAVSYAIVLIKRKLKTCISR